MLCAVYKSLRKPETYLFVAKRDDFSSVPAPLLEQFGQPQLVTMINMTKDTKMAMADTERVINELNQSGFYLQLPPPPINHLQEHKNWLEQQKES